MAKDNTKFTGKNRLDIEARRYSWLVYDYFDFYRKNGWGKLFGRYYKQLGENWEYYDVGV